MAATYNSNDYNSVAKGGLVHEDVLNKIVENVVEKTDAPFLTLIGNETSKNSYKSWTEERLPAIDLSNAQNAVGDGADVTTYNNESGSRLGNHHQIIRRNVRVSTRANNIDLIGTGQALVRQIEQRMADIRRAKEAIMLSPQASRADAFDVTSQTGNPGLSAGLVSFLKTHNNCGSGGSITGFNTSTGLVAAPTNGTIRTPDFSVFKDLINTLWEDYASPSVIMGPPKIIAGLNRYLVGLSSGSGSTTQLVAQVSGTQGQEMVSQQYINKFKTDHGVYLTIIANRNQQLVTHSGSPDTYSSDLYILSPEYLAESTLVPVKVEELAKTGLTENRQISEDFTLEVKMERAHAVYRDLNQDAAWQA